MRAVSTFLTIGAALCLQVPAAHAFGSSFAGSMRVIALIDAQPAASVVADTPISAVAPAASEAAEAASGTATSAEQRPPELRQQRVQALEENVATLRVQLLAAEQASTELQHRLSEAEAARYANPLVYALAALSVLLAGVVATLWRRQSSDRRSVRWRAAVRKPATERRRRATKSINTTPAALAEFALVETPADAWNASLSSRTTSPKKSTPSQRSETSALTDTLTDTATRPAPFQIPAMPPPESADEPAAAHTVDVLIDLEQQVEFCIVLGQDDAAIELLMNPVRSDDGTSPLPYLLLLEIYKRRGDASAYERIRERFDRRFGAKAPDWSSDLQQSNGLVDYPATVQRIQALWAAPNETMDMLAAALIRRPPIRDTFDLPTYRELLILYAVARDLSTQEGGLPNGADTLVSVAAAGVGAPPAPISAIDSDDVATDAIDLLLPLGDDARATSIARLHATTPLQVGPASPQPPLALDLDLSAAAPMACVTDANAGVDAKVDVDADRV